MRKARLCACVCVCMCTACNHRACVSQEVVIMNTLGTQYEHVRNTRCVRHKKFYQRKLALEKARLRGRKVRRDEVREPGHMTQRPALQGRTSSARNTLGTHKEHIRNTLAAGHVSLATPVHAVSERGRGE